MIYKVEMSEDSIYNFHLSYVVEADIKQSVDLTVNVFNLTHNIIIINVFSFMCIKINVHNVIPSSDYM